MNSKLSYAARTCVFIAIASCSRTAAADDSGWYVGAGLGEVDYGKHGILHYGSQALDATVIDDSDAPLSSSISLAFGYRLNRYLSLEAAYMRNDPTSYALTDDAGARFGTYEFRSEGASLAVVGTLPLGNWELFARAGVLYADTDARLVTDFGTLWSAEAQSAEALGTIGAAYNFTDHWQARFDYTYVRDAGQPHETGHVDVEVKTLGFTYRF
jgi:opacity protein-like surface antigen